MVSVQLFSNFTQCNIYLKSNENLPHCVIESAGPQLSAVSGDVYAGGAVRVSLELPHQRLVVEVPHCYVAIRTTAEANLELHNLISVKPLTWYAFFFVYSNLKLSRN